MDVLPVYWAPHIQSYDAQSWFIHSSYCIIFATWTRKARIWLSMRIWIPSMCGTGSELKFARAANTKTLWVIEIPFRNVGKKIKATIFWVYFTLNPVHIYIVLEQFREIIAYSIQAKTWNQVREHSKLHPLNVYNIYDLFNDHFMYHVHLACSNSRYIYSVISSHRSAFCAAAKWS